MTDINTHGLICDFGKHRGQPYTRLPVGYLQWMVNGAHQKADIAAAELKRRGTVFPDMDISGHAIDRASQQLIGRWTETRKPDEGLHAWLIRMATDARARGRCKGEKYVHADIKFVFEEGSHWPVLKTVMIERKQETHIRTGR